MTADLTNCPECGHLAEVEWRATLDSTDGPVEHAQIHCVQRHWFLLPVAQLDRQFPAADAAAIHKAEAWPEGPRV